MEGSDSQKALDENKTKRYIENRIAEDEYESTKNLLILVNKMIQGQKTKRETTKLAKKEVELCGSRCAIDGNDEFSAMSTIMATWKSMISSGAKEVKA